MPRLRVAVQSVKRLRAKLKTQFRVGRGRAIDATIKELVPILRGWTAYFRLADVKGTFEELDGWVHRKLRATLWRQWKKPAARVRILMQRGIKKERASTCAFNGRGPWWNARTPHMHEALPNAYFTKLGLVSFLKEYRRLHPAS
jgi:RNA-directed DNA polymerase